MLVLVMGCSDVSYYTGVDYTPRVDEYPSSYSFGFGIFYRIGNEHLDNDSEIGAGLPALQHSQR